MMHVILSASAIAYESQSVVRKTRAFTRNIARIGISTLVFGTPNP